MENCPILDGTHQINTECNSKLTGEFLGRLYLNKLTYSSAKSVTGSAVVEATTSEAKAESESRVAEAKAKAESFAFEAETEAIVFEAEAEAGYIMDTR